MPLLHLTTNIALEAEQKTTTLRQLSQQCAEWLGKSENYVMVLISDGAALSFGGSEEPAAYMELKSLGLPDDSTHDLSKAICRFLESNLSIPSERIYIEFTPGERHLWGWNSKTF